MSETITIGSLITPERGWPIQQETREMIQVVIKNTEKETKIMGWGDRRELVMTQDEAIAVVAVARALDKISRETNQSMRQALEIFCNREYQLNTGRVFKPRQFERDGQIIYRNV